MSAAMKRIDPTEITNIVGGDKERIKARKSMIKDFLTWLHKNKSDFSNNENEDSLIVKHYFYYWNAMKGITASLSLLFYAIFLRSKFDSNIVYSTIKFYFLNICSNNKIHI